MSDGGPIQHPIEVDLVDDRGRLATVIGIFGFLGGVLAVMAAQRLHEAGGVIGPVLVGFGVGLATIPALYLLAQRRRWIVRFDPDGVVLRGGRRLPWSALRTARRRTRRAWSHTFLSHYELTFAGATGYVFPARVRNVAEVCELLDRLVRDRA